MITAESQAFMRIVDTVGADIFARLIADDARMRGELNIPRAGDADVRALAEFALQAATVWDVERANALMDA